MKPQMLIFMGGPGVGKGTFSNMIRARHDFKYIEMGAMLRALPDTNPMRQLVAVGELVPDTAAFELLRENVSDDADILLDGFPRTLSQAKWLAQTYADKFDIHIVYLDAPTDIILSRIEKRRRETGGRRDDANPNAIMHRIQHFHDETMPAIEWLRDAPGIHFVHVDARGTADENFAEILAALGK